MTGLVRKATLLTAMGLMAAGAALAGVPSAGTSVIGTILHLGGVNGAGVVDVRCERQITVRDAANNAVPNSKVEIIFGTCYGNEIRISMVQPFAGMNILCGTRTVWVFTNASGVATFRVQGASNVTSSAAAGAPEGCATVKADGVSLGSVSVATADQNGANAGGAGVTGGDTILYNGNRFGGVPLYRPRSNFIGVAGTIDGGDTIQYNGYRFLGGSSSNAAGPGGYCP